jgi:hypothetical protein
MAKSPARVELTEVPKSNKLLTLRAGEGQGSKFGRKIAARTNPSRGRSLAQAESAVRASLCAHQLQLAQSD